MLLMFVLLGSSGCSYEVISRKFIRKKKQKDGAEIHHVTPFKKEPNSVIYQNCYLYWKSWEDELLIYISQIGHTKVRNAMKLSECSSESLSNLRLMQSYLVKEKADELSVYVQQLEDINDLLEDSSLTNSQISRAKHDIEIHKRNVQRGFSYRNAKKWILPDEKEEEGQVIDER